MFLEPIKEFVIHVVMVCSQTIGIFQSQGFLLAKTL
jgi:hypothetical protein